MGKPHEYFLIARNRLSNRFQVIPVNGKRSSSLEEIDLYTTSFKDSYDLEDSLQEQGVLTEDDTDFFIVNQSNIHGEKKLFKQEALFSIHSVVRDIAKNSMRKKITDSEYLIDHILDSFADSMRRKPVLFEQVVSGQTNVFEKYANYFVMTRQNLASIKYRDGGWARTSYSLIRNIVEASSRVNTKYARISDNMYRGLLEEPLLRITDPNYDPAQISLFDSFDIEPEYDEDKLLEVMTSFEHLPATSVLMDNSHAFFNPSTFSSYQGDDLHKLSTYLPEDLLLILRLFFIQRDCLNTSPEKMGGVYQKPIQQGQKDMIQLLKSHPDVLDRAYDWCQLYHQYEGKVYGRDYQKQKGDEGTN